MPNPTSQVPSASGRDALAEGAPRSNSRIRRVGRGVFLYALVPYLAITVLFTLFQRRLIYYCTPSEPLLVAETGLTEDSARDVSLTTDDGLTLHGWLLKGDASQAAMDISPSLAAEPSKPLVLYFPGNAQHRRSRLNDLRDFTALGCDVLIFDYRGYAENDGSPSEGTMAADARAIWRYAVAELHVKPNRIFLFGESMGGAVAVSLAQTLCLEHSPPAGLVTNATFASLPRLAARHYPLFPFRWLVWDRWPSLERIRHVTCPVLMFHGTADNIVPITEGRTLFTAAPTCSADGCEKTFVEIEGAGHNDIPVSRLQEQVAQLLSIVPQD